jgi:hypothetical protein
LKVALNAINQPNNQMLAKLFTIIYLFGFFPRFICWVFLAFDYLVGLWRLTPLSTIFQLYYRGGQFN